jgi:hypothetical protein
MNTQEIINNQHNLDPEFVEIVDRNFWEMISPLTENPKSVTHEVVIPDQGSSGKLDHHLVPPGSTGLEPLLFLYPEQPSEPLTGIKINWHITINENVCPHCKQIINLPRKAQI